MLFASVYVEVNAGADAVGWVAAVLARVGGHGALFAAEEGAFGA